MGEFSKRVLKPAALPIACFGFIGVLVFAFSRILLAVPEVGSTTLAFLMALAVLVVCSVFAATSRVKPVQRLLLIVVTLGLLGAGGAAAEIGVRELEHEAPEVHIAAEDLKFIPDRLPWPADETVTLIFENRDSGIPHNVEIFADDTFGGTALFTHTPFNGVATQELEVEPLTAGAYAFRCVVHPQMTGTIDAGAHEPGGPPGGSPPPPGEAPTSFEVTAAGFVFTPDSFALKADVPTTITFHNEDASALHNVAIYGDEAAAETIFREEPFAGPATVTYQLPPVTAGEYFFRCDVHQQMTGTVEFR